MTKKQNDDHNKLYYDIDRNIDPNANRIKTFEEMEIPAYYIGKKYKIEARKVVSDFNLSFNVGSAVTYLLRHRNKHKDPRECINKAIKHLIYELEELNYE
tara:strand:- start:1452 stop:1751 length:300 start_codon:yes stop_codon:yes gene_type:complete